MHRPVVFGHVIKLNPTFQHFVKNSQWTLLSFGFLLVKTLDAIKWQPAVKYNTIIKSERGKVHVKLRNNVADFTAEDFILWLNLCYITAQGHTQENNMPDDERKKKEKTACRNLNAAKCCSVIHIRQIQLVMAGGVATHSKLGQRHLSNGGSLPSQGPSWSIHQRLMVCLGLSAPRLHWSMAQ